jgi:hypothetical protein
MRQGKQTRRIRRSCRRPTVLIVAEPTRFAGFPVVTEPSESYLGHRQLVDYRSERRDCIEWRLAFGKNPERGEGYAEGTVKTRSYRMDQFYRWVWDRTGGYTINVTHDHADEWMKELAQPTNRTARKR